MTNHRSRSSARRITRVAIAAVAASLGSGVLTACSTLLEADAPSRILESTLLTPSNAPVLVAGAVADFECAFGNFILTGSTQSDEFSDSQANAATWDIDRRTSVPASALYATGTCSGFGVYSPISTARFQADQAITLLDGWTDTDVPGRAGLIARTAAYAGYSYIMLGEMFCSAAVDLGPELTPAQVFALAEQRFTRAIDTPGVPAEILNMSLVGRARARINQNKRTEAAADAARVPDNFVFNARTTAAANRAENRMFRFNNTSGVITVDSTYRNLRVGNVADPRVRVIDAGRGGSLPTVRLYVQQKYLSLTDPLPIATWREARLIQAEVAGGQAAVGIINALRARHSLPVFASSSDTEIQAQVREERRRELFVEGHRLFDTIRFNVPLSPAVGAVFPNGGGTYGANKCLPLPDVERLNNPSIGG
ncbi:MAG: RagB/SusD family nutrient uptake outer membrane protein [Gemmatimonadetes bacterium]|nr:RagB/SusD family nutrient uptake outer membrane protein [Gemmatimonadota bacterium]MCC6770695.1 RagB/SusD family nutrient uptake outer membrane protein [Gemmatimonadaceae bacterium]